MAVNKIALGNPKAHFQTKPKPMVMIPRNYKNWNMLMVVF